MKQLLFLPLFFLFASGVASAQVRKLPTIDCENDAKLELYLQLIAEDIYGQKYGCDTPFPMRKASLYIGRCGFGILCLRFAQREGALAAHRLLRR